MLRTSVEIATNSDIIDTRFKKYNIIAFCAHMLSAIFMFSLYIQRDPLIIPYESYLAWNNVSIDEKCPIGSREFNTTSNGKFCISATTQPVSCDDDGNCYGIDLGWLIISFHILSFVFQYS